MVFVGLSPTYAGHTRGFHRRESDVCVRLVEKDNWPEKALSETIRSNMMEETDENNGTNGMRNEDGRRSRRSFLKGSAAVAGAAVASSIPASAASGKAASEPTRAPAFIRGSNQERPNLVLSMNAD